MTGRPEGRGPDDATRELREALARAETRRGEGEAREEAVLSLVGFRLAEDHFALRLGDLDEIFGMRKITPVPFTPPHILGVLNYRGDVLPVADLRVLLRLPAGAPGPRARVLVARRGDVLLGILAEEVFEVMSVPGSRLEPPLATLPPPVRGFLEGVFTHPRDPDGAPEGPRYTVHLLDLGAILQPGRPPGPAA